MKNTKIVIKKIRRNMGLYSVIVNGMEYVLNACWDGESLTGSVTETKTGDCWFFMNLTDLSEDHEMWAEIVKAYIKWSFENE